MAITKAMRGIQKPEIVLTPARRRALRAIGIKPADVLTAYKLENAFEHGCAVGYGCEVFEPRETPDGESSASIAAWVRDEEFDIRKNPHANCAQALRRMAAQLRKAADRIEAAGK